MTCLPDNSMGIMFINGEVFDEENSVVEDASGIFVQFSGYI